MRAPANWPKTFAPALALLGLHAVAAHGSRPGSETALTPAPAATELCEYRTINYITHTLPQQCLRTSWTSPTPAATDDSTEQPTTTTAATTVTESPGTAQDNGTAQEEDRQEELAASSFMSFEEWKEMMLRKSGQDPSNIKAHKQREHRERDPGVNNPDVDSFGEEGEISLDFDALNEKVSEIASSTGEAVPNADKEAKEEQVFYDDGKTQYYRSKDAGKTCKERFSYASFDAGATVLKTSPRAKNAKAILVENKDSYMLLECRAKTKFVIVELSDDILVDTVVIANFEFFSSMVRKFSVSVSDRYPVKLDKWVDLGTFEARNSRDIQAFLIEHPQIYTKYIRIEFLSHWGNEFYCPVSLLRVHGTRMLDTWKEPSHDDEPELIQDSAEGPAAETQQVQEPASQDNSSVVAEETVHEVVTEMELTPWQPVFQSNFSLEVCELRSPTTAEPTPVKSGSNTPPKQPDGGPDSVTPRPSAGSGAEEGSRPDGSSSESASPEAPVSGQTTSTAASAASAPPQADNNSPASNPSQKQADTRAESTGTSSSTTTTTARNKTSSASSASASPTVQESFFKTMTKRLQLLESNTSLSLQYIEEQSRFLQDVLLKMERKQITRVDVFLDNLNKTVLTELRNVRTQYDQIWQSTVLALETQRDQSQREIVALTSRLNILADEVVFQKRMAILQSVLLLACLILVIFSRGGLAALDSASFPTFPPTSANTNPRRYGYTYGHNRSESGLSLPGSSPQGAAHQAAVADRNHLAGSALPRHLYPAGSSSSAPASFKDKSLPLTPPSEYSRENTPSAAARTTTRQLHHSPESSSFYDQADEDRAQHHHQNQSPQSHSSTIVSRPGPGSSGVAQHHQGPTPEPEPPNPPSISSVSLSSISTFNVDQHSPQGQSQADTDTTIPHPQGEGEGTRRDGPQEETRRDGPQREGNEQEQMVDEGGGEEQEKPPLPRARSTMSQLGASGLRKPLPALPEDPS